MGKHTTWGEIREARMQDPAVRAQYEKTAAELGTFWADVELGMQDPEFRGAYVRTRIRAIYGRQPRRRFRFAGMRRPWLR